MTKAFAIKSCSDIAEIMLPVISPHGMTVFNYYKIYFDGRMIRLSTDKAWTEQFFKKNYMHTMSAPDAYLIKPRNHYIWLTEDCPEMLLDAAVNFNTSNGISIAVKTEDYIEYFCFATSTENTRIINTFYLDNLDKLYQYGLEFKEKSKNLIDQMEKNPLQLVNQHKPGNPNSSSIKLSRRQSECAQLLLLGKKTKEIGTALQLSPRTIEYYIENLKIKLQCQNKTELLLRLLPLQHLIRR